MRLLRGWAPALRIARRDALRAPGRSALIVAMIALPVLGMSSVDVLVRSAQLDPPERATRELGRTQARLTQLGSEPIYQSPDGGRATSVPTQGPAPAAPTTPDLRTLVPSGFRVLTEQSSSVTARTRSGVANVGWAEVAAGDPAFRGHFVVSAGRAPRRAGEVAVTAELLQRLGARIGGRVRLTTPDRTFSLVGVLRRTGQHGDQLFWAAPGTLIGTGDLAAYDAPTLYLVGSRPVTWTTVTELNTHGVQVVSRAVLLDPPARADVPYFTAGLDSGNAGTLFLTIMMIAVVIILYGLEVVLLAGAAFAVGARRQARALGLLAANGGAPGQVRRVVLGGGLVLGVAGACVGVLLGLVTAAVARAPLGHLTGSDFGHYDVRPLELLAIAFVGVVTGLLAAVLPARTAARQDPVVALSGRRGVVRTPRKVPAIGLTTVVLGIAAAALGSSLALAYATGLNPTNRGRTVLTAGLIGGGAALAQIGLIICSPAIMGLAGRWSTRLPLAGRLALRDAARHRGRSAPAMAAVLTAVTGSTALALYVSAVDASDRASYRPSWPASTAGVQLLQYDYQGVDKPDKRTSVDPARVEAAVQAALPAYTPYVVRTTDERCDGTGSGCSSINLLVPKANLCPTAALGDVSGAAPVSAAARDPRCQERGYETGNLPGTVVDDGALLRALHAPPAGRAASALRAGGVVVFDPRY
ncbi:MAG: FtsX-like permease family protein, partial [Actinomycetes bacterium]